MIRAIITTHLDDYFSPNWGDMYESLLDPVVCRDLVLYSFFEDFRIEELHEGVLSGWAEYKELFATVEFTIADKESLVFPFISLHEVVKYDREVSRLTLYHPEWPDDISINISKSNTSPSFTPLRVARKRAAQRLFNKIDSFINTLG